MFFKNSIVGVFAISMAVLSSAIAADEGDSMLVLDGSGSMWGQINNKAKIVIAKDVLGELLADLPAERRLGLMAYGHNREGDCTDIEELASVGADRSTIAGAVQGISPKGKTPMADSIKIAAEKLQYTERKATVILVSDGIETCEPDPCGVAAALEAAGADFTAHVIGFDVREENEQAQLRCLAENTGGTFVSASNADELSEALETTVVETPEVDPNENLFLRATELEGGLLIEEGLSWNVTPSAGGDAIIAEENAGTLDRKVEAGEYDVSVVRPSDGLKGEAKGVVIHSNAQKTVTIALTFPVEANVRVEPTSAVAGSNVKVYWEGPNRKGDYVGMTGIESDQHHENGYRYTKEGTPVEMRLPVEPGKYEIRYMLGRPVRTLAKTTVDVIAAEATLDAQETAVAGEEVSVNFTGPIPASGDFITITEPGAKESAYKSYHYTKSGAPAMIKMPLEPGDYELRFVQKGQKVLARRPITVTQALATLTVQETAKIGETIAVTYTTPPEAGGDYITVTKSDASAKKYNGYSYTVSGKPAELRMPFEPGEYEIRYVQDGKVILTRKGITVEDVASSVAAKSSALAGETISVEFAGPPVGSSDYIVVAETTAREKKYINYAYVKSGSPASLRMPLDEGEYEIRYLVGGSTIIAKQAVSISPAAIEISAAPTSAPANSKIDVSFDGEPAVGKSDYISIAKPGAADRQYETYNYATNNPVTINTPKEPGDYEIRYIQANKKAIARRSITITVD